jgi:DNA-binding CsgD family transcriptional regulator
VTAEDGIAELTGYPADAALAEARLARGTGGDGPARPLGNQPPRPAFMLISGPGDPAAPPAPRQAGPSAQGLDPIAAALEVIATSRPAASRGPSPASGLGSGSSPGRDPLSALTPRETEVLSRIAEGQNTKKMAREMNVTTETLRTYVRNVLTKLGAHSRLEAAALATQYVPPTRREQEHDQALFAALTPPGTRGPGSPGQRLRAARGRQAPAHVPEDPQHAPAEPKEQARCALDPGSGRAGANALRPPFPR